MRTALSPSSAPNSTGHYAGDHALLISHPVLPTPTHLVHQLLRIAHCPFNLSYPKISSTLCRKSQSLIFPPYIDDSDPPDALTAAQCALPCRPLMPHSALLPHRVVSVIAVPGLCECKCRLCVKGLRGRIVTTHLPKGDVKI